MVVGVSVRSHGQGKDNRRQGHCPSNVNSRPLLLPITACNIVDTNNKTLGYVILTRAQYGMMFTYTGGGGGGGGELPTTRVHQFLKAKTAVTRVCKSDLNILGFTCMSLLGAINPVPPNGPTFRSQVSTPIIYRSTKSP